MKTLDRYIAKQFFFNLVMLYVVVATLFVLLDLIINFDEFAQAVERRSDDGFFASVGALISAAYSFYWPQMLLLFVYVAGLLPVGAAGFTLAALVRNRELVAMLAGGVSLRRVMIPMIFITIGVNVLLIVDREIVLPPLAERLVDGHAQLRGKDTRSVRLRFVMDGNGSLFTTPRFDAQTGEMKHVTILIRERVRPGIYGRAVARVTATQAIWNPEYAGKNGIRSGWELINGHSIREPAIEAGRIGEQSREVDAVEFIESDLDPQTILLREKERYRQLLSSHQLGALMNKGHLVNTREIKRLRHSRWSLPVVNLLILLMGLPFFLLRTPGPLLLATIQAATMCVPAWAGGFVMHQLSPEALPAAAVAWLPVALYLPIAYYLTESIET